MKYTSTTSSIMNDNDFDSNAEALLATRDLQQKSIEALHRIQQQAAETQAIGLETMDQLDQQDHRMDSALETTTQLNDNLKKASKLQDRFGFLSLQMGNKKAAKQQVKTEHEFRTGSKSSSKKSKSKNETAADAAPKFKRRGPRPKKQPVAAAAPAASTSIDDVMQQTSKKSHELKTEVDRNELFAEAAKPKKRTQRAGKRSDRKKQGAPQAKDAPPMTEQERRELQDIEADDKAVDAGLDILGNQMEHLLGMAKDMNETVQQQNTKLTDIDKGLTKADDRSKQVNQRAKLFTLNRREKRKEKNKFETPMSMKANAAMAAMTM